MNSYEIGEYKMILIRKLIQNDTIVSLIDPAKSVQYADDLIYTSIFPYNRIPDTEQEVKTYVTIRCNVPNVVRKNDLVRDVTVIIRAYTHEDLMRVSGRNGTRIDCLAAEIDRVLNETMELGIGPLIVVSNTEHVLDSRHHYRELLLKTQSINNDRSGVHQWMN